MSVHNKENWVFWEDMWNPSQTTGKTCCGEWNDEGECTCADKIN